MRRIIKRHEVGAPARYAQDDGSGSYQPLPEDLSFGRGLAYGLLGTAAICGAVLGLAWLLLGAGR